MDSNQVTILGRHYSIAGMQDRAYLEKLARFVDAQMRKIMEATGTVDTMKVAILAALNIADCYFRELRECEKAEMEMQRNITALSKRIKQTLSA